MWPGLIACLWPCLITPASRGSHIQTAGRSAHASARPTIYALPPQGEEKRQTQEEKANHGVRSGRVGGGRPSIRQTINHLWFLVSLLQSFSPANIAIKEKGKQTNRPVRSKEQQNTGVRTESSQSRSEILPDCSDLSREISPNIQPGCFRVWSC
ncbi:hypothetical protein V8F20_011059 [Naviculisporaceae sp. PSN 640]